MRFWVSILPDNCKDLYRIVACAEPLMAVAPLATSATAQVVCHRSTPPRFTSRIGPPSLRPAAFGPPVGEPAKRPNTRKFGAMARANLMADGKNTCGPAVWRMGLVSGRVDLREPPC